ncbi:MAG: alpha/beta hydrolase [Clostridia bacterium]|nr:alpha/beta hydrolase [Clostridia bacterium]
MYFDEYGSKENPSVLMLHGAFFTDSFCRQYKLSDKYRLIVPHIKGFGRAANETFDADVAVRELEDLTERFAPVYLVGFSLGAQLAFRLVSEKPEYVRKAIIVSPWLVNKETITEEMMNGNLKMLSQLKNRLFSGVIGFSMGLSKEKRNEFSGSMRLVSEETVRKCVDNKISFETVPGFRKIKVPVLALAGSREAPDIIESVKRMSEINDYCRCELFENAKHNIPTAYAKRFNQKLTDFFTDDGYSF